MKGRIRGGLGVGLGSGVWVRADELVDNLSLVQYIVAHQTTES